jgi:hypothetical protein
LDKIRTKTYFLAGAILASAAFIMPNSFMVCSWYAHGLWTLSINVSNHFCCFVGDNLPENNAPWVCHAKFFRRLALYFASKLPLIFTYFRFKTPSLGIILIQLNAFLLWWSRIVTVLWTVITSIKNILLS